MEFDLSRWIWMCGEPARVSEGLQVAPMARVAPVTRMLN